MDVFVKIANQVLYFGYDTLNKIFHAFGLSWLGVVSGLAVISVILRLFASNLVGGAVSIHRERREASAQQRIEKQKAASSRGRGASYSSASSGNWKFSKDRRFSHVKNAKYRKD